MRYFCSLLLSLFISLSVFGQDDQPPTIFPFSFDGQWGLVDQHQHVVMEPSLDTIGFLEAQRSPNAHALGWEDGRVGVLSYDGRWLSPPRWDEAHLRFRGRPFVARVQRKGRWGLVNLSTGKMLLKARLSALHRFDRGEKSYYAPAATKSGYGIVDSTGSWVVPPRYDTAFLDVQYDLNDYSDNLVFVLKKDGEQIVMDEQGNILDSYDPLWLMEEADDMIEDSPKYEIEYIGEPENGLTILVRSTPRNYDQQIDEVRVPAGYEVLDVRTETSGEWPAYYEVVKYYLVRNTSTGLSGIFDREAAVLVPVEHDRIARETRPGLPYWRLEKDGLIGYAREWNGQVLYPARFTRIDCFPRYHILRLHRVDGYSGYGIEGTVYLPQEE